MESGSFDLKLVQGGTYKRTFTLLANAVVYPLADYTIRSEVRAKENPASRLLLNLDPYLTVANDVITLRIPATVTAALRVEDFKRGAFWDLFLILTADPTEAGPLLQGEATLDPAATNTLVVAP